MEKIGKTKDDDPPVPPLRQSYRYPAFWVAVLPLVCLTTMLSLNVILYKTEAAYGPNQMAIIFSSVVAMALGVFYLKVPFVNIEKKVIHSIGMSLQAMLILLIVGALIGSWIVSGIVPTMVYYGLDLISPNVFLPVACLVSAVVSMTTGSSWPTTGTVGVAFMGVGTTMGFPPGLVAGAILSGAYFGDKMSPLSDTTNLAAAVVGVDLIEHIRHMLYTSMPAFILSVIVFACVGAIYHPANGASLDSIQELMRVIKLNFNIGPHLFFVPILIFWMVAKKIPAILALLLGVLLGLIAAVIFQQESLLREMPANANGFSWMYKTLIGATCHGAHFHTGNPLVDDLFSRGGMKEMLNTIWIVFSSMVLSGTMEETKMLEVLALTILKRVTTVTGLIWSTLVTCTMVNVTASDQYLSVVIPGKMFKDAYRRFGLKPKNLSRALEDAGSVTSCLVPWNSCGAYHSSVLGVATLSYLPFCFFSFFSPMFSMILAITGFTIEKLDAEELKQEQKKENPVTEFLEFKLEQKKQEQKKQERRQKRQLSKKPIFSLPRLSHARRALKVEVQ